jgi:hypothetical protein
MRADVCWPLSCKTHSLLHVGYGFTVASARLIISANSRVMQRLIALAGSLVSLVSREVVLEIKLRIGLAVTVSGMTSRDVPVRTIHFPIPCR